MIAVLFAPFVSADAPADTAEVRERILEVMERYPAGSYFTNDGGPCSGHNDSPSFSCANCRRVTAEEAGTEGNMQCFGFGRMVFWQVFGLAYPHYSSSENWKPSGREMKNVVQVWWGTPGTELDTSAVRQAFSFASVGDVVHTGLPHTMIFLQCESDGILVYDANFDMYTCRVQIHLISWRQLARWVKNNGMSVYRAADYPELGEYQPFALPGRDVGALEIVSAVNAGVPVNAAMTRFDGLSLTYEKGEIGCTLLCTGGTEFELTGSFGDMTVTANADGELSPHITVTAGSAPSPGRIRVEFLDAVAVLDGEVAEPFEPTILSYTCPSLLEYAEGEELCPSGASVTVFLESGETAVYDGDAVTFIGFDSSRAGECLVFMEAHGLMTPPFAVTVIAPATEAPAVSTVAVQSSPGTTEAEIRQGVRFDLTALGLLLCALGIGILRLPAGKNAPKRRGE